MQRKPVFASVSIALFALAILPAAAHAVRGVKELKLQELSFGDCKNPGFVAMELLFTEGTVAGTPPSDYMRSIPGAERDPAEIIVDVKEYDPRRTVRVSAEVWMPDNLTNSGRYNANELDAAPEKVDKGSLGLKWQASRLGNPDVALTCTDCMAEARVAFIQRTWHKIAVSFESADPKHQLETAHVPFGWDLDPVAKPIILADEHVSMETHETRLFLQRKQVPTPGGPFRFYGGANAWRRTASGENEPVRHTGTYVERNWDSSTWGAAKEFETDSVFGSSSYDSDLGDEEGSWGMRQSAWQNGDTAFDFTVSVEAYYSSVLDGEYLDCGEQKILNLSVKTEVNLLLTDRDYSEDGDVDFTKESFGWATLEYGSFLFVWKVQVMKNCDNTPDSCPCVRYQDDNINTPDTP